MKKQLFTLSLLTTVAALGFSVSFIHAENQSFKESKGYSIDSLPTTIYLNDSTESEIRSYYSSLNSLSSSELSGTNLLKNLKPILKNGQKHYSYDYSYGTSIWQMYEIADRDWEKSPASSTTYGTYNASTNTITNYSYGTNSSTKNNPYLHALYVNRDVDNQVQAFGDHSQKGWGINREHVWAKSHGMGSDDDSSASGGARGDPMHLLSGNGYVNGFDYHGNLFYGFVNKNSSYSDAGTTYSYLSGNLMGTSASMGSGSVFEPQDSDKGDIARIVFYMAARYNYLSGSDDDGIDANNPNLTVVDTVSDANGSSSYDATTSTAGQMGLLRDLLAWNRLDPPDEWEIHRNNLLFKNYTNNRNPFIDFPEWAEYIWGTSTLSSDNRKVTAYDSTSTGSASPSSDAISVFDGGSTDPVAVTGVYVSPTNTTLKVGQSTSITVNVTPSNATNKNYSVSVSNSNVSYSNSIITANAVGSSVLTITTEDGGYTATVNVTIEEADDSEYSLSPSSPYINGLAYKMYFYSTNKSQNYYFSGSMSGNYGATTTDYNTATEVFFEPNGNGQNIYFMDGTTKNYITVVKNGNYYNFHYESTEPTIAWLYQERETIMLA